MLDFAPDEVRSLQPLLKWAGLKNRFISARVLEITKPLETIVLLSDPRRSIQHRAHSLCQLAIHSDKLNIHIPKDTRRQDLCLLFDLPHAFFEWIMSESLPQEEDRETELAKRLIASVLNPEPHSATWFLDKENIIALDVFEERSITLDASAAGDVSAVKVPLRRYRVRLPPVQTHTVTAKSNDGVETTEIKKKSFGAAKQRPEVIFTGAGLVETELCSSTAFEALRLASPSLSSDGHSSSS
ncbi:hypothetical protein GGR55DRAFT_679264 [Xylaria sp. FL0064]|nr:hypothetical protein GGR55DRAFT_679264 [Xylaria sp. FL0064]